MHLVLTNAASFIFKKNRYAKTIIQKVKLAKNSKPEELHTMIVHELKNPLASSDAN